MSLKAIPISSIPFLFLWAVIVVINFASLYRTHVKKRFTSSVPLLGSLFGLAGFLQIPQMREWWWVAVLTDYGTLEFVLILPKVSRELWQVSRFNLIGELTGEEGRKKVSIRLYKAGVFVIDQKFNREKTEPGLIGYSDTGNWQKEDGRIILKMPQDDIMELEQHGEIWKVNRSFSRYENSRDLNVQHMNFIKTPSSISDL